MFTRKYRCASFVALSLLSALMMLFSPQTTFSQLGGTLNGERVVGGPITGRSYEIVGTTFTRGSKSTVIATTNGFYTSSSWRDDFKNVWTPPPPRTIKNIGRKSVKTEQYGNTTRTYYVVIQLDDGEIYIYNYLSGQTKYYGTVEKTSYSESFKEIKGDALYDLTSSTLYASRDSGKTWQADTAGLGNSYIWNFDTDSSQYVYIATTSGLFKQHPDSSSWDKISSLTQTTNLYIVFIDKQNRILVGANGGGIYLSTDNGASWAADSAGIGEQQVGIFSDDELGNLYAVAAGKLYKSSGGTTAWSQIDKGISSIIGGNFSYTGVSGDTAQLDIGTSFGVFVSTDQGATWSLHNNGIRSESIYGMVKTHSGNVLLSNAVGIFSNAPPDTTWTKIYPQNAFRGDLRLYHDDIGNVYTVDGTVDSNKYSAPSIVISTDGGNTWAPDTAGLDSLTGSLFYVDGTGTEHYCSTYYGSTRYSMLWYKPHGGSWTIDTTGFPVKSYSYSSSMTSDDQAYLYVSGFFNNQRVMRRPLAGGTWVIDTNGIPSTVNYFDDMAGNRGKVVGSTGTSLMYRGAGAWSNIPFPSQLSFPSASAICIDDSGIVFAAFTNFLTGGMGVYFTRDNGATWVHVGLDSIDVNSLVSFGDSTYALSYDAGAFYIGKNPVQVDVRQKSNTPNSFVLFQNYPNPFNPSTVINYRLPATSHVTLKIYDILGREVAALIDEKQDAGTHSIRFDGSRFASGVYFYRLSAGGQVKISKMLMLK